MNKFKLPDLGEGLQEAEIVTWHVAVGDRVVADQPLVSVETDKAVVEVPSPRAGRVAKLCAAPGDIVKIGETLVEYDDGDDHADAGTVVGTIESRAELIDERRQAEGRAGAAAVKATPAVRALARRLDVDLSIVSPSGRRLHAKIDLGVAVDTADGLFVPVLHDIANRDPADLRRGLDRMKADVEARTVPSEEMRGATITLSNFGTLGGRYAAPVVVPPQVAILSAGRVAGRVVAAAGKPAVHRTLPLSLTFDHRAVTGGEAARFLAAAIADLEKAK